MSTKARAVFLMNMACSVSFVASFVASATHCLNCSASSAIVFLRALRGAIYSTARRTASCVTVLSFACDEVTDKPCSRSDARSDISLVFICFLTNEGGGRGGWMMLRAAVGKQSGSWSWYCSGSVQCLIGLYPYGGTIHFFFVFFKIIHFCYLSPVPVVGFVFNTILTKSWYTYSLG